MNELLTYYWQTFSSWDAGTKAGVIGLLIVIGGIISTGVRWLLGYVKRKGLENRVNTDSYPDEVFKNSTKYYVRSDCSSVDPTQESEIRHLIATTEDLFIYIDKFRESINSRYLLVLADSGMGKTSFVLNYFSSRLGGLLKKRKKLAIVYLGTQQALDQIRAIEDPRSTDIILDAFDEDTAAIDDYAGRLGSLLKECQLFRKVIITCRTQFFPRNSEIPVETGLVRVEPRAAGSPGHYELYKVYLAPLTDKQVNKYLAKRFRFNFYKRRESKRVIERIPLLSVRPMILSYIPDLIGTTNRVNTAIDLYQILIDRWIERESNWVDGAQLLKFSEELAINLFEKRKERGAERIPRNELLELAEATGIDLEEWKLTGRSLLNRDAVGNYKFAHRSIMEFLLIKTFLDGRPQIRSKKWTDMMKNFYVDHLKNNSYFFAPNLERSLTDRLEHLDGVDLSDLDISKLAATLRMYCSLEKANLDGATFEGMDLTSSSFKEASLQYANLSRCKMLSVNLEYARLTDANLTRTNCTNAKLSHADLTGATLVGTKFMRSDLKLTIFRNANLHDTDFWHASVTKADFRGSDLRTVVGLTKKQLDSAIIDDETQLPSNLMSESKMEDLSATLRMPDYDPYVE